VDKRILIIGYGNADRQDDGVAWHVLAEINQRLDRPSPASPDDGFETGEGSPELLFVLQLTPEMAETISEFERVCFVDAHTGQVPGEVHAALVQNEFQTSPFTHHLTPSSLVSLCATLYGRSPEAILVSVRGYQFGFEHGLSPQTAAAVPEAGQIFHDWLQT